MSPVAGDGGLTQERGSAPAVRRRGSPDQGHRRDRAARRRPRSREAVEDLFLKLSEEARTGGIRRAASAPHAPPGDRRPRGAGRDAQPAAARGCRREGAGRVAAGSVRPRSSTVTVLMSDIRGYSAIAERTDPSKLAGQLNEHRAEMNRRDPRRRRHRHAVRRRRGDGVLRRAGAAQEDHAQHALDAARRDARARRCELDAEWADRDLPAFGLGIGCRPVRSPPRCSDRRSVSSTRWSATP